MMKNPRLLLVMLLTACGGTLPDNGDPKLAAIEVTSDGGRSELAVNETLQLTAQGLDASGAPAMLGTVEWTSSSNETATVDDTGLVTGMRNNEVTITARDGDVSTSLTLTVRGAVHSGTLAADETWHAWDNPHFVRPPGVVIAGEDNPTLTIEAGVQVQFDSDTQLIVGEGGERGRLQVTGTEEAPVVFTSDKASPAAGDFGGLVVYPDGEASLEWLVLEYAGADGGTNYEGCVQLLGAETDVVFDHVTISHCQSYGVFLGEDAGFGAGSTNLVIEDTAQHALYFHQPATVETVPPASSFDANPSAIRVRAGSVSETTTWANHGVPYIVDEGFVVVSGTGRPVLTIEEGTTLRFGSESGIQAALSSEAGELKAVGTEQAPIVFTADSADPSAGDWAGLIFDESASSSSRLEWAVVEYAGGNASTNYSNAAVAVFEDNKGSFITHTTIRDSAAFGVLRADTSGDGFVTDFTTAGLGNVFENNADGDQGDE